MIRRYGIEHHSHRFAALAAGRASSIKGCRFTVETGRAILEDIGLDASFTDPEELPAAKRFDTPHRIWRTRAKKAVRSRGIAMTDGVAAKLINVYLKCRFICGGHHDHSHARDLHPPIDELWLKALALNNIVAAPNSRARRTAFSASTSKLSLGKNVKSPQDAPTTAEPYILAVI
jgi:hypothetical protein